LVFVPPSQQLSYDEERAIYDLHQNDDQDQGYQTFLSRLSTPLLEKLQRPSSGLDFGSGPGPTLAQLFKNQGHQMELFDIHYANQPKVLENQYDFITLTEVAEHLKTPNHTFSLLFSLLKTPGYLAVMTKRVLDLDRFRTWHYKNDPTHISFYSEQSLQCLAHQSQTQLEFYGQDVAIFVKL
jgi:hypothetical protein